jgi:hypothetical protein
MFTGKRLITTALALTIAAGTCFCEDTEPTKFYKLDFVVKEIEGTKLVNTRAYTTVVSTGTFRSEIRAGSKIRYSSGPASTYQLLDVGASIDAYAIKAIENRLAFSINVVISSVPGTSDPTGPAVIHQNTWGSAVIVPLKKTPLLFSSDNIDSKSQMQVEVTATPLP